jgi:serine/threonine protein kinase
MYLDDFMPTAIGSRAFSAKHDLATQIIRTFHDSRARRVGRTQFLIMEPSGETLAQRLAQYRCVAEALAVHDRSPRRCRPHERIVHRDLKPANITLSPGSDVKVLASARESMTHGSVDHDL